MKNLFAKLGGQIAPIPTCIKNTCLLFILLFFIFAMILCAYNGKNDSVIALASILLAIILSPIFSVRVELEKQRQLYLFEKKYQTYRILSVELNDLLAPLRMIMAGLEEKNNGLKKLNEQNSSFSDFYRKNYLFLSKEIRNNIHSLFILIFEILGKNPDVFSLAQEIEKKGMNIIDSIREELQIQ